MENNNKKELQIEEDKKTYTSWDLIIGGILCVFSIFVIARSLMMPTYNAAIYARPGIVPFIVGVLLLGVSVMLIIKSLKNNSISLLQEKITELAKFKDAYRFLVLSVATLIYIALLDLTDIHFIILTLVFLWVVYIYLKLSILKSTILSIASSVGIYFLFTQIFSIPMP